MSEYTVAYDVDLGCHPNYSFAVGDVDGDGQQELISLNQSGNRLRVHKLNGDVLLEKQLVNHGNWGSPLPCLIDVDGDGREEIVVPSLAPTLLANIVAINAEGEVVREHCFNQRTTDDYGIAVPLTAPFRFEAPDRTGVLAALAGGTIVALDADFNEAWRADGFRNDFGHEFYMADVDGDGLEEVAFSTVDHVNGFPAGAWNVGESILMDHDGTTLMRRLVSDYLDDHHFDDVALADFRGNGQVEIMYEKGFLVDFNGDIIWDVSQELDHGQWIAHTPDPSGKGRLIFISELWGYEGKSSLYKGDGTKVADIVDLPRSLDIPDKLPGWRVLPTRVHAVQWTPDSQPEFFLAEQVRSPTSHNCFKTETFDLNAFFLDLQGNLIHAMPFSDAQIEGYWYNGEVHSVVVDVDGDGMQEIVFPRQDGHVMVIKKDQLGD